MAGRTGNPAPMRTRMSVLHSTPSSEKASLYDYCMVFKLTENGQQTDYSKFIVKQMLHAGLDVFSYWSIQRDEIITLIRCPVATMKKFANDNDYMMELEPVKVKELLAKGLIEDGKYKIKPIDINDSAEYSPISPYDYIYGKFRHFLDPELYAEYEHVDKQYKSTLSIEEMPFNKYVRLKLIYYMLQAPVHKGGCDLQMSKLIASNTIECFFPMHDEFVSSQICEKIVRADTFPWTVPFDEVRYYFGEKIALYQVFLGHYSKWLFIPAVIGAAFQVVVWATNDFSHPVLPFYCLVITVWAVIMLEFWKQNEKMTAMRWGMTEFESQEPDRPEYKGFPIDSYINGEPMLYFPPNETKGRIASSQGVVLTCIALVLGVVSSIYVLRFSIEKDVGTAASTVASILNTMQIIVFNMIYQKIATYLTNKENHRTSTQYEDSLIAKLFIFQFINSYSSFFFLAFIAQALPRPDDASDDFVGQCAASSCMQPLSINLAIIFGTRLFCNNLTDLLMAKYNSESKFKAETNGAEDKLTPAEKDYVMLEFSATMDNINNFADTAIQFGFATLFISALPIASFLSLVANYVKVKMMAWKLCKFYQRPIPLGAQDIGIWLTIFQVISVVSVVTNAGLVCFTMDTLKNYTSLGRAWIFIGFQWTLITIQFIAERAIPDESEEYTIQTERIKFITTKLIERDDDDEYITVEEWEEEQRKKKSGGSNADGGPQMNLLKKHKITNCPEITVETYASANSGVSQQAYVPTTSNPMISAVRN